MPRKPSKTIHESKVNQSSFENSQKIAQLLDHGLALHNSGKINEARVIYEQILNYQSNHFDAIQLLATTYGQQEKPELALKYFDQALQINKTNPIILNNKGIALQQLKRLDEALKNYEQALHIQPDYFEAHNNKGNALQELNRFDEALQSYEEILSIYPHYAEAHYNKSIALKELKRFDEALQSYEEALRINPNYVEAHNNKGNTLQELKRYDEALQSYDEALRIKPKYAAAFTNKGNTLQELKRLEEALQSHEEALRIKHDYFEAHTNKGNVLKELERFDEALQSHNEALRINPNYAEAHNNKGNTLQELKRFDEALQSYEEALRIKPDYAAAFSNKGLVLQELNRFDEALQSHEAALRINPDFENGHNNKGSMLEYFRRFDEARQSYEEALRIKPDYKFLLGKSQHIRMFLCDWGNFDLILENLKNSLIDNKPVSHPFELHALLDSPDLQKKSAEIYITEKNSIKSAHQISNPQRKHQKIKIGYFSSDFSDHPVSHLVAGVLEEHDRKKFEIIAFSLVNNKHDLWRDRIRSGVDQFIDVSNKSDKEVADLAQSLELDIAIDLNGHTKNARTGIFSYRAAPIQASYIGFLGTMGATYYDYLIADPILIPEESREFYTEKIVYLPSYQCNDNKFSFSDKNFTRKEFGLPDNAFIFCSFNSNWKITPLVFDAWMRILNQVSNSVLWIYVENKTAKENLYKEAQIREIDPNRLIFAERIPLKEHLARLRLADLSLDTFPYNSGATASNALRVGLPLITRSGKSFASRYGASLLSALGVPELITNSTEEFENLAVELALRSELMHSIKEKLTNNLDKYPLFDTAKFTRSIESAFSVMYERSQNQLQPDHIYISD